LFLLLFLFLYLLLLFRVFSYSLLYAKVTGGRDQTDSVEVAGAALIVAEGRYRITRAFAS